MSAVHFEWQRIGVATKYQQTIDRSKFLMKFLSQIKNHFILFQVHSYNAHSGEMLGGLSVLTAETSQHTIRARHHTKVAILRRNAVYSLMRERPLTVVYVANSVVRKLSPLVRQCDYALDWVFLESGRAAYRQDETSDCTYIVLSGRLRSIVTQTNGKKEIVGEYGTCTIFV